MTFMKGAKIVAYVRVSTDEQVTHGVSLEAQERAIRAYCAMRGLTDPEVIVDAGVSAGKPLAKREGGRRVLELARAGEVDAVVSLKLDRLFRDCADCLDVVREWDQRDVALHLVDLGGQTIDTSTAMGRFFLTVMAGAAELERNLVGERTKDALVHVRMEGVRLGGEALGWRRSETTTDDGRREVENVEEERETLRLVHALHDEGLSLRAICAKLTALNRKTKRGGAWRPKVIASVLRRSEAC